MRPREIISKAETAVPIEDVLRDLYAIDVPRDAGDWKSACPLGYEHSDGGRSKAMRVYSDNNTAWCFSHSARYTPLDLWKIKYSIPSRLRAATEMLGQYGISTEPPSPDERWGKLDRVNDVDLLDREVLKEIFRSHCRTLPGYAIVQYDAETLDLVTAILKTVNRLPDEADYNEIEEWLKKAKKIMKTYWRRYEHN